MGINWNDYELRLCESSSKECEVTGREMGGDEYYLCSLTDLLAGKGRWIPENEYMRNSGQTYGGYGMPRFSFLRADEEGVHLLVKAGYDKEITLSPEHPDWSYGWYDYGTWSYCVSLELRKINKQ